MSSEHRRSLAYWLCCACVAALVACGGGSDAESAHAPKVDASTTLVRLPDGGTSAPIPCKSKSDCPSVACDEQGYCELPPAIGSAVDAGASSSTPSAPSDDACEVDSDCTLVPVECCGACPRAYPELVALNQQAGATKEEACVDKQCTPRCAELVPPTVRALCRSGRCVKGDVAQIGSVVKCNRHEDCQIRSAACCECGASTDPGRLVAISDPAAYARNICSGSESCDTCAPQYPAEVLALCRGGLCTVADPRP